MNPRPKRLVLLDAHAILHRAYHALPDFSTSKGEPTGALYGLSSMLIKIIEDLKPDWLVACYDVKGPTYRHEAFKEYKAQRKKADDELITQINRSRDIFTALGIPIYDKQGYEADDILGTIVEQVKSQKSKVKIETQNQKLETVIASGDMDTLQLVSDEHGVKVYTLKKGIKDTIMYDEKAVRDRFGFGPELIPDYKGLRGDPSDNIPGIKGFGDKTATALIKAFGSIEDIYHELGAGNESSFKEAGLTPRLVQMLKDNKEEAEFSKVLATINRQVPIEFKLPAKTFKEGLDMAKINALWTELEFRTLGQRLKQVMEKGATPPKASLDRGLSERAEMAGSGRSPLESRTAGAVPFREASPAGRSGASGGVAPEKLQKAAVALWLVNSNITNPKLEDVLNFANTEDFDVAEKAIFAELDKRGLRKVYEDIESPLIPVLDKMEKRGVKVDKALLAELSKEYHASVDSLEKRIWQEAGIEFNINSPKQLGDVLFDKLGLKPKNQKKTAGGARSTRESELEKLRGMHPVVPLIFEYRELSKLLSTYIDAIPPLLDEHDRLHTHFIQSGTTTGRMASENPNLQNIPIHSEAGKKVRGAFVAERGFKLAAFDYSQMELRIAAFMSGDENMISIFLNGEDVHKAVAARVFGVSADDVTPEMRRRAKVINFGIIYGMGVLALKQNLGTTREEAQRFLDDYFRAFSGLAAYLDRVKVETARRGYTETFFGRRRYFEGIHSKIPYIRAAAERMAINAPIQGTEADVIKLAMIHVDGFVREEGLGDDVFPLLQIHDELVYEIRADGKEKMPVDKVTATIEDIMQSVVSREKTRGIVLEAKASVGDDWGELK
ncbi:MAG: hypothetical protein KGI49_03255 [Patescibacteria group bacterium]|nr:hypothetical protein [Patescibacteria group bacterium]